MTTRFGELYTRRNLPPLVRVKREERHLLPSFLGVRNNLRVTLLPNSRIGTLQTHYFQSSSYSQHSEPITSYSLNPKPIKWLQPTLQTNQAATAYPPWSGLQPPTSHSPHSLTHKPPTPSPPREQRASRPTICGSSRQHSTASEASAST